MKRFPMARNKKISQLTSFNTKYLVVPQKVRTFALSK